MTARLPRLAALGLLWLWFPLSACQRLSNELDQAALTCGEDVRQYPGSRFVSPEAALANEPWQGVSASKAGFKALPRSSRGCLVVEPELSGPLYLRHQNLELGASLTGAETEAGDWPSRVVRRFSPLPSPSGLSSERLSLSCGASLSNRFFAPYQLQRQASPQLHLYRLRYELLDGANNIVLFGEAPVDPAGPPEVELPKVLADGEYQLRWSLFDVFENLYAGVKAEPQLCQLQIDTKGPETGGFRESLPTIRDQLLSYQEVSPGQALNLKVDDAAATQIFFCLYALGQEPCTAFSQLSGPIYAPEDGAWNLRYYAVDAAGNRSPPIDLPPLAVMHREVMQSIENLLALARLKTERNQFLEANKHLLEAYRAYYSLKLPLEKAPLSGPLGLAFSEVARSQHLLAEIKDHSQAVTQFEWIGKDASVFASLDSQGSFVARKLDGSLQSQLSEVAAFAAESAYGPFLLFKDGSYQLGLNGRTRPLPAGSRPSLLAVRGSQVLFASSESLSLFTLRADASLVPRWTYPLSGGAQKIALSADGSLAVLADRKQILSLDSASGRLINRSAWDERCLFSQLVEAPSYGWFIALRTDDVIGLESGEEFHCEMLRWNAREAAVRLAHEKVLNPNDPFHKPADYRFEEVSTLAYAPQHRWLAFGRNLDPSFVVYDLEKDFATVYEDAGDPNQSLGEVSALGFSPDGRYFSVSQSQQLQATIWDLGTKPDLASYLWQDFVVQLPGQPRVVEKLLIHPSRPWLLTSDEGRQTRIYNFATTLLPRFSSELSPAPSFLSDAAAELVQLSGERVSLLDPYGKVLFSTSRPEAGLELLGLIPIRFQPSTGALGLLALDRRGRIWITPNRSQSWQLIYDAAGDLSCSSFLPSPSRSKLLLSCQNNAEEPALLLISQNSQTGAWTETLRLSLEARQLAWSPSETHFSTLNRQSASLWSLRGERLIEDQGERVLSSALYQPFSSDGQRWLSLVDGSVSVWDIAQAQRLYPAWKWPQPLSLVSFAGSRTDRLWLVARSSGRGETVVEADESGKLTRNFGEFAGSLRLIFERAGSDRPWAFDNEGRLFQLNAGTVGPTALISIKSGEGEIPLALNQPENFLLTQDNRARVGVLFLNEDRRQLDELCGWLEPMLKARTDPTFASFGPLCQAEPSLPAARD